MKTTPEHSPLLIEVVDILGRRWAFSPKAVAYLCDAPGGGTLISFKSNYTCTVPADYTNIRDQIFAAMPHLAQEPGSGPLEKVHHGFEVVAAEDGDL